MTAITTERCEFCSGQAIAYQRGALVCGRCGVRRTLGDGPIKIPPPRRRRTAVIGFFTSGLVIKLMMGSVALAAVGGFASASVVPADRSAGEMEPTVAGVQLDAPRDQIGAPAPDLTFDEMTSLVSSAQNQAVSAHKLATAAQEWADCVSDYAKGHHGEGLNPKEVCGPHPRPSQFGLGDDDEPGVQQSGDDEQSDSVDDSESPGDDDALEATDEKPEKADKPDKTQADGKKPEKTDRTNDADPQGDDTDD